MISRRQNYARCYVRRSPHLIIEMNVDWRHRFNDLGTPKSRGRRGQRAIACRLEMDGPLSVIGGKVVFSS